MSGGLSPQKTKSAARFVCAFGRALRTGWLRSPSWTPRVAAASLNSRECKRNANAVLPITRLLWGARESEMQRLMPNLRQMPRTGGSLVIRWAGDHPAELVARSN